MKNPGEDRERESRNRRLLILGLGALIAIVATYVLGIAGTADSAFPHPLLPGLALYLSLGSRIVVTVVVLAALALVARLNWNSSDEVGRSRILGLWAATGVSVCVTFFGFLMFGSFIPPADRLQLAFVLPCAGGLLFAVARWLRDGYVR
jgi:hypothetical protein